MYARLMTSIKRHHYHVGMKSEQQWCRNELQRVKDIKGNKKRSHKYNKRQGL